VPSTSELVAIPQKTLPREAERLADAKRRDVAGVHVRFQTVEPEVLERMALQERMTRGSPTIV